MGTDLPQRKALRLRDYDYSTPGAYFITFCTYNRKTTLSRIVGAIHESPEVQLTECGRIVDSIINSMPSHLKTIIDHYVIMPNHIHMILMITDEAAARAICESPLRGRSIISKTVGYIKMNASKAIHECMGNAPVWQRGYYDHIIRDSRDYEEKAKYILENPYRWKSDQLFSEE